MHHICFMPLLLNIDTATNNASVAIFNGDKLLIQDAHQESINHASFIQQSIQEMLISLKLKLVQLDAIAVTIGPGSYTGVRVGLATAKGLCYAINKPLIAINKLTAMAKASFEAINPDNIYDAQLPTLLCPMIDARRMEVFTALYNHDLSPVMLPTALILTEKSFEEAVKNNKVIFSGSGASKFQNLISNEHTIFLDKVEDIGAFAALAYQDFIQEKFADIAYLEPLYLKEVHFTDKKQLF